MASAPQTLGHDAPVTLKVFYDGATRRAKMLLREMAPQTLEKHVRAFLQIPDDAKILIERYSDSAGAYVLLDAANAAVYKQLYRAAKAKSKLKLRVTAVGLQESASPSPAVEGVVDAFHSPVEDGAVKTEPQSPVAPLPTTSTMTLPLRGSGLAVKPAAKPTALPDQPATAPREPSERKILPHRRPRDTKRTTDNPAALYTQLGRQPRPSPVADAVGKPDDASPPPPVAITKPMPAFPVLDKPIMFSPSTRGSFAVCCNSCERTIPDAHYHCSTCDDGDFDLCEACVNQGITCYSSDHWLIKRVVKNGQLVNSTTETIASKPKPDAKDEPKISAPTNRGPPSDVFGRPSISQTVADQSSGHWACVSNLRTCNCCVQELPEQEFLHCTVCEDLDLCQPCFARDAHGHHPKHAFAPAAAGVQMPDHIKVKMAPGRNQMHHAICDGCDKYITGVRHKCLDCPDWDYCSDCVRNASFAHANHRFVPVYEPLTSAQVWPDAQPIHIGICCDGPLCSISQAFPSYIRGVRYKCAVCHDLDYCANCEASPSNPHNKTHPLIKFKTPVRHVSVTTTGEHQDGKRMPAMGDRNGVKAGETMSTTTIHPERNSINAVQTVVDVKPLESPPAPKPEVVESETRSELETLQPRSVPTATEILAVEKDLRAVFVRDTVEDGTILPPNHVFEQTWILRNEGSVAWPPGCSVKFVGGDYMGHVDSAHPAGISELVSASESTVCYAPLAPGQEFSFTVLLRTPPRSGRVISYWRLTTQYGHKFGHRLWCEVNVHPVAAEPQSRATCVHIEDVREHDDFSGSSSTMVFPKLDKESPGASIHEDPHVETESETLASPDHHDVEDGFEACGDDDEWDGSEDGFMTDEEYDILDASDEEFLEQQQKKLLKK